MRGMSAMAKRKDTSDLFSQPAEKKKAEPPPPPPPVVSEAPNRKGKREWLTNGFELPSGIDRSSLELGEPRAFGNFTVEALKKVGAMGIYQIA